MHQSGRLNLIILLTVASDDECKIKCVNIGFRGGCSYRSAKLYKVYHLTLVTAGSVLGFPALIEVNVIL